jgi:thiosulfate reductase cytochrome b subunit
MFYRYPQRYEVISLNVNGLKAIALVHTLGAFALVCFFIAHLYLITTGSTATSNLKAMITGFDDLPDTADLAASPKKTAEPAITH